MPPNRSESWRKLAHQEGKLLLALDDVQNGHIKSLRAAAKRYDIPYSTLHARANGQSSRVNQRPSRHKLTQLEEDSLAEWVISLDSRGLTPGASAVRERANTLLALRGETPPATVGKNWPSTFIQRRDDLRTRFSRHSNSQGAFNEDPNYLREHVTTVQQISDENGIQRDDIRNVDETEPTMGLVSAPNVSTQIESPPSSRPSSRSSPLTSETSRTVIELQKHASMLKELLKQRRRSHSPPSPSRHMLDQIIKSQWMILHNTALLAQEIERLRAANGKKRQKQCNCPDTQMPYEDGHSVGGQPVEGDEIVRHAQGGMPTQANRSAARAPPRCSGCREIGHKINGCKNRQ